MPGITGATKSDVKAHQSAADEALQNSAADDLELLHETLEGAAVPLEEVAALLFDDASSLRCYAAWRLLDSPRGRALFKRPKPNADAVAPRDGAEAAALLKQLDAAEAEDAETRRGFQALERLGCRGDDERSNRRGDDDDAADEAALAAAKEFLKTLGRKATGESARALLVQVGVWDRHEDLQLIRHRVPIAFSDEVEAAAAALADSPPPDADAARRVDMTAQRAYAIDAPETTEVDDALGVEFLADGGTRVWVHVADASRYVVPGSAVDLEARRRQSTIYLPTGLVPMVPLRLAEDILSLRDGTPSCALSFGATLDADGALAESTIQPTLVAVERLTYAGVDEILADRDGTAPIDAEGLTTLRALEDAARRRLEWRKAGGALDGLLGDASAQLPEMRVAAERRDGEEDGWHVSVAPLRDGDGDGGGAARRLVSELMLLAGEAVAQYAEAEGVPLVYRRQAMREIDAAEVDELPAGPCRTWAVLRGQAPSTTGSEAAPGHAGLGLDRYAQCTSPIRRYGDLAIHHQIKAALRGEIPPFLDGELLTLSTPKRGAGARQLERAANARWLTEFLRRRAGQPLRAVVLGAHMDSRRSEVKVLLPELGAIVDHKSARDLKPGDEISLAPDRSGALV